MRRGLLAIGLAAALGGSTIAVRAETLVLTGDKFWVVGASRTDPDAAIATARNLQGVHPKVVRAANGYYAAIVGPYEIRPGRGRAFLDDLIQKQSLPKDIYLTKGASFSEVVWTPPASHVEKELSYDGESPVSLQSGDLKVTLSRRSAGTDGYNPVATGFFKGAKAFSLSTDHPADKPAARIQLVRLDPKSPLPQVVFTYFWQGAHCCTVTKIASLQPDGTWQIIDGDDLDGDGGYQFEDLDNKGFSYLISADQSFLYAFSSYAASVPPIRIQALRGNALIDVTREPRFRHRILQDLAATEMPNEGDERNGYLAGFVADSILVGQGAAAWAVMLRSYDHQTDFLEEACLDPKPVESCADKRKVKLSFPYSLRQLLIGQGYISAADAYPVPAKFEPAAQQK
jgi:hypothetical protein